MSASPDGTGEEMTEEELIRAMRHPELQDERYRREMEQFWSSPPGQEVRRIQQDVLRRRADAAAAAARSWRRTRWVLVLAAVTLLVSFVGAIAIDRYLG